MRRECAASGVPQKTLGPGNLAFPRISPVFALSQPPEVSWQGPPPSHKGHPPSGGRRGPWAIRMRARGGRACGPRVHLPPPRPVSRQLRPPEGAGGAGGEPRKGNSPGIWLAERHRQPFLGTRGDGGLIQAWGRDPWREDSVEGLEKALSPLSPTHILLLLPEVCRAPRRFCCGRSLPLRQGGLYSLTAADQGGWSFSGAVPGQREDGTARTNPPSTPLLPEISKRRSSFAEGFAQRKRRRERGGKRWGGAKPTSWRGRGRAGSC